MLPLRSPPHSIQRRPSHRTIASTAAADLTTQRSLLRRTILSSAAADSTDQRSLLRRTIPSTAVANLITQRSLLHRTIPSAAAANSTTRRSLSYPTISTPHTSPRRAAQMPLAPASRDQMSQFPLVLLHILGATAPTRIARGDDALIIRDAVPGSIAALSDLDTALMPPAIPPAMPPASIPAEAALNIAALYSRARVALQHSASQTHPASVTADAAPASSAAQTCAGKALRHPASLMTEETKKVASDSHPSTAPNSHPSTALDVGCLPKAVSTTNLAQKRTIPNANRLFERKRESDTPLGVEHRTGISASLKMENHVQMRAAPIPPTARKDHRPAAHPSRARNSYRDQNLTLVISRHGPQCQRS